MITTLVTLALFGQMNVRAKITGPVDTAGNLLVRCVNCSSDAPTDGGVITQTPASTVAVSNFPATQAVTGTFWPQTQPVSGSVSVSNFPATQPVSIASMPTTPVTGTFWQATQPVSGSVSVSNFPATQPVSGTLTCSGPLTDTQLRASAVPVSGPLTDTQLRAAAVPVSGPLTDTQLRATPVPTTIATATGKTLTMKTGTLASSAVTADQVVLTYTVTTGKTFYLQYWSINVRLTTFAATATFFGNCSLESPAGTKLFTKVNAGAGVGDAEYLSMSEPLPIAAGTVIRWVCTPSATTAMTWQGNFGGFEK